MFKSRFFGPLGKRDLFVGMYSVVPKSTTINNATFNDNDVGEGNENEDDDDYEDNEDDAVFAVRQHQFVWWMRRE